MTDRPINYAVHPATVRCSVCHRLRSGDPCYWCVNPFADAGGGPDSVQAPPLSPVQPGPPLASYSVDDVCPPGAAVRASPDSTDSEAAGRRKAVGTVLGGHSLSDEKPPCGHGCGCAGCVERVTLACEKAFATLPRDVAVSTWERLAPGKRP